ncbi:MAG: hypothetical protein ABII18_04400 [bacterium]
MTKIHVTAQDIPSNHHNVEVTCKKEYKELATELSHYATIFNDELRSLLPVDEFESPDIEMHGKARWKLSKFFLDPYGSLEVKGTKIWTPLPDFKESYLKFYEGVTEPASPRQLERMSAEERAVYDANRALLQNDLDRFKEYLSIESGDTFNEIMAQYPEETAFQNMITYNYIALEYAEYYLLELGLTLDKLGGYTKFVALASLLGQVTRYNTLANHEGLPKLEASQSADLLIEMYAKQRENDINQEKVMKHPFRQMAATLDFAPLAWITYMADVHFGKIYSQDVEGVQKLMAILVATEGKITDAIFLEAIAEAYNQSHEDMMQSPFLRIMYDTLPSDPA